MAAYTMSTAGPILKEVFDPVLGDAISKRSSVYAWFRKIVEKTDINTRGYNFAIATQDNQGYGSLTSAQEGGLLPRAGNPSRRKIRADYRDHFVSGELTGRVIAQATDKLSLVDLSKDAMKSAVRAFDKFQDFYLFGNGSGSMGVTTTAYNAGTPTLLTFALAQATPYGSMMIQAGQRVNFYNAAGTVQRTGGISIPTVVSKDFSTDIVTFDAVPTDVIAGDIIVIEDTLNREVQGLDYFVGNSGTTWLVDAETGTAITRASNGWTSANVIDKAGAALSPDFIDTMALQTSNQTGDGNPDWKNVLLSHPCQQNQYRKLGYTLNRTVNVTGNKKLDLGFAEVSHNGMEWKTSANCQPDRLYGLMMDSWIMPEVQAPHMKDFQGGTLIQKPGTDRYYDAAQFAVEARYTLVCRRPFEQFLLKNLAFQVGDVRRNLN